MLSVAQRDLIYAGIPSSAGGIAFHKLKSDQFVNYPSSPEDYPMLVVTFLSEGLKPTPWRLMSQVYDPNARLWNVTIGRNEWVSISCRILSPDKRQAEILADYFSHSLWAQELMINPHDHLM